jgi:hypothetical protein
VTYGTHTRGAPTVAGSLLNLGPNEVASEKVIELAKHLEAAGLENRALLGRIRDLEAAGVGREQALAETLRDVEVASAEVARARADIQVLRKEIAALRDRLEKADIDEVETLRLVIASLERILEGPPPAGAGKKP